MKKLFAIIVGVLLASSLVGCGRSDNKSASKPKQDQSMKNMKGMKMGDQSLTKAFQDELNGFTTIENDVNKGDFKTASAVADNLHNEFHAAILPPLKDKKGETYAENIHGKYDELQDAVASKDKTKIAQMIKVNRDNLVTVAKILGVSLK
jgi:hypothetical protein